MKAFHAAVAELNLDDDATLTPEIRTAISKQVVVKLTERDRFRVMIENHEPVRRTMLLELRANEGREYPIVEVDAMHYVVDRFAQAGISRGLRRYRSSAF